MDTPVATVPQAAVLSAGAATALGSLVLMGVPGPGPGLLVAFASVGLLAARHPRTAGMLRRAPDEARLRWSRVGSAAAHRRGRVREGMTRKRGAMEARPSAVPSRVPPPRTGTPGPAARELQVAGAAVGAGALTLQAPAPIGLRTATGAVLMLSDAPRYLPEALALLDELTLMDQAIDQLCVSTAAAARLRPAEVRVLFAVGGVAPVSRQLDPAAISSLLSQGMLSAQSDWTGPAMSLSPASLRLAGGGPAALQQVEGLRIRALEHLLASLEPGRRQSLQDGSRSVAASLSQLATEYRNASPTAVPAPTRLPPTTAVGGRPAPRTADSRLS